MFGVKTVPQEQFKKYLTNKDYKDQLERLADSVSNYYKRVFVAQLNKPHKTLVDITNDLETTLNSRLGSSSVSFGTTQNLSAIQAMLKMCCALEQTVGKIVTSINTSIVGQIGLMKVQKK